MTKWDATDNVVPINGEIASTGKASGCNPEVAAARGGSTPPLPTIPDFSSFWKIYPKKVARLDAEKMWNKLTPAQRADALTGISVWSSIWLRERELQFVPAADRWLRGQRWEDELPAQWGKTHASQVVVSTSPPLAEHTAMPDDVREKLREFNARFKTKVNI